MRERGTGWPLPFEGVVLFFFFFSSLFPLSATPHRPARACVCAIPEARRASPTLPLHTSVCWGWTRAPMLRHRSPSPAVGGGPAPPKPAPAPPLTPAPLPPPSTARLRDRLLQAVAQLALAVGLVAWALTS